MPSSPDDRPPTLDYADRAVVPWWATWVGVVTITAVSWATILGLILYVQRLDL